MIEVFKGRDRERRKTVGEGVFLHCLDMPNIVKVKSPCNQNATND